MKYENITRARFLKRPNRFIAEVEIDGCEGRIERVHVKNTGRCKELLIPGCEVWLTEPGTPGRKTKYDLVAVRKSNGVLFNIDSQAPNKVVGEWLASQGYSTIIPEYKYGDSRIDFYMERLAEISDDSEHKNADYFPEHHNTVIREHDLDHLEPDIGVRKHRAIEPCTAADQENGGGIQPSVKHERYLMEVKGCTLEIDGIGYFPDAPTERGVKHIRELIKAQKAGYHAILAFVIQMDGVEEVHPNTDTHPEFGTAMEEAIAAGVQIIFFTCHVEPDELVITGSRTI